MTNQLVNTNQTGAEIIERVMLEGDLSQLSPNERIVYYKATCESLGLNPLTKPFDYIKLNNKLTLYAKRDATDQLRKIHNVSVAFVARERLEDVYMVTARATLPNGRTDESAGVVSIGGLKGDALANALMKAETKAKRRVTLSIVGLGLLDETELETIPNSYPVDDAPPPVITGGNGENTQSAWDTFLARTRVELNLDEDQTKAILKELGVTGFKSAMAQANFEALKDQVENSATTETAALLTVNRECNGYYKHINHLRNSVSKIDPGFAYPPRVDQFAEWQIIIKMLIEHANAKPGMETNTMLIND